MGIVKYNPFRELRVMQEQMNRLLDSAWSRGSGEEFREAIWQPPVDIYEDDESVVITAEIPDVDQNEIEVKIDDGTLTLRGERKEDRDLKRENFHRMERYHGPFQRSFTIPGSIDQDNIRATSTNGVLTITLPKRPASTAKPITVEIS